MIISCYLLHAYLFTLVTVKTSIAEFQNQRAKSLPMPPLVICMSFPSIVVKIGEGVRQAVTSSL
jgi:branched-subunit amino acid permease